jgi:hypothetical protein
MEWVNGTLVRRGKVRAEEVGILKRARTPQDVLRILKRGARVVPGGPTAVAEPSRDIP